jgi:putative heme-binding domain-containing protein
MLHEDAELRALVVKHFGEVQGATTSQMLAEIKRLSEVIGTGSGVPHNGKQLYMQSCGKCHKLFTAGGEIGPNLTSFQRQDLQRVLVNVVNPSLEIREGYENYRVITEDGRVLTGFVVDQDDQLVVLRGADGQTTILQRDAIEEIAATPQSLMPEELLKRLNDQQVRDLFAFLRSSQPVP